MFAIKAAAWPAVRPDATVQIRFNVMGEDEVSTDGIALQAVMVPAWNTAKSAAALAVVSAGLIRIGTGSCRVWLTKVVELHSPTPNRK